MKKVLRILSLAGLLIFAITANYHAQDKKIDKLEMLYDQGNYSIVLRKSSKMLGTPEYKQHPAPMVFHALAEYQMSKNNEKFSSSTAIYDYEQFMKLDTNQYYRKAYANYIYDLQTGIAEEIQELTIQGNKDKAKIKYDSYERLFGNIADFEEMTTVEPEVVESAPSSPTFGHREGLIKEAEKHIGTPYKYGGITTKGFDCSGFTQFVFSKNGYVIPRTASAQATSYEKVKISDAQTGDLVFFGRNKNEISHVGIVYSNTDEGLRMIHASSSRGVMISNVDKDPYWNPKLQYAVKIVK